MTKTDFGELMSIGVDSGKDVFHLVGSNYDGQRVLRKKISGWHRLRRLNDCRDASLAWRLV